MKTPPFHGLFPVVPPARRRRAQQGFTLMEALTASAVFTLVMGTVLSLYVFAARVSSGVSQQFLFGAQARILNFMAGEVKAAQQVTVENYNGTNFTTITYGQPQQGNALALVVTNGSSTMNVYYWLSSTGTFFRAAKSTTNCELRLSNITNTVPFAMMTYQGAVASNTTQRLLVGVTLLVSDPNTKNFRQAMILNDSVENRN